MTEISRRKYLRNTIIGLGGAIAITKTAKAALETCGLTPAQTEGPFYPIEDQNDKDNDLTRVKGKLKSAEGEVIYIEGVVIDSNCRPVENALVEIWQACASGKYNHPGDPNPAALDPNFQYWGRAVTNKKGEYSFKTIKPGHYAATSTWTRPAHIHLKVHRRGFEELTSQLYFKGDKYNDSDRILQSIDEDTRERVIVDLKKQAVGPRIGKFDISIKNL